MLRVWTEFLTPAQATGHLDLLARHRVSPCLATQGWSEEAAPFLRGCAERGLEPALWPLLPREEGYFPNEGNLESYGRLLGKIVERAARARIEPSWMAVDLEPPLDWGMEVLQGPPVRRVGRLLRWPLDALQPRRFEAARKEVEGLVNQLHKKGWRVLCAAAPLVLDQPEGTAGFEDLLESPVLGPDWDRVSFMLYSSMVPGLGGPRGNPRWVFSYAREARRMLGERAAVSLGVTGRGILGSETLMAAPEVLGRDVAAARAAGIGDIALYNLEGSMRDPEGWLGALGAPARDPGTSVAVEAARAGLRLAARGIEGVRNFNRTGGAGR